MGVLSSIVLIAEPEQLDILRQRPDFSGALAFTDSETPSALEAILIHRPPVVAVERVFAAKSRGAALINRIKADPTLETCEIRIVAHDSSFSRVAPRPAPRQAPAAARPSRPWPRRPSRSTRRARAARSATGSSRASRC